MSTGTMIGCPNCAAACSPADAACVTCGFPIGSLPDPPPYPVLNEYLGTLLWQAAPATTGEETRKKRGALIAALVTGGVLLLLLIGVVLFLLLSREAKQGGGAGGSPTGRSTGASPGQSSDATQSPSPTLSPSRSPSPSPTGLGPRPGGGSGTPVPSRSPDLVAARAAQALNAGDQGAFEALSFDEVVGESTYALMIQGFGRPGWESGECEAVGPLYACRMFHSGAAAGAIVLDGTEPDTPIIAWGGPSS